MKRTTTPLFALFMLCLWTDARAQTVISASRSMDWHNAGVPGGIPSRTSICATFNPGATAAQINQAIANCSPGGLGGIVKLNAGTYNLSAGITFNAKNDVTLRGAGADQTFLVFSGSASCAGLFADICFQASGNPVLPSPSSSANWTAGYSKGTTSITLSTTSGLSVGSLLILDQLNDGTDVGNIYVCAAANVCTEQGGGGAGRSGRAQQQVVLVRGINGSTVTISPGLNMPNWRSSQSPGAFWASNPPIAGSGVENLSLDHTNSGSKSGIAMLYSYGCWVKGVRSLNSDRNHVWVYQSKNATIRDSYFYGTLNAASQSYGVEFFSAADILVENSIFQHIAGPSTNNGSSGAVVGYNYCIDNYYAVSPAWMIPSIIAHDVTDMLLAEGNDCTAFEGDGIHGTHNMLTAFRNYLSGESGKTGNTGLVHLYSFSRFFNVVGNVIGRSPYYNTYETNLSGANANTSIYTLGDSPGGSVPNDALVKTTLLRWGNYDTVTATSRFLASEVPSGLSQYSNPVPANTDLPASLYLSLKPAWWPASIPWPAIGPDVTGGPGPGGHAYKIPAHVCYDNTSKTNSILNFNATNCYQSTALSAPTNLRIVR